MCSDCCVSSFWNVTHWDVKDFMILNESFITKRSAPRTPNSGTCDVGMQLHWPFPGFASPVTTGLEILPPRQSQACQSLVLGISRRNRVAASVRIKRWCGYVSPTPFLKMMRPTTVTGFYWIISLSMHSTFAATIYCCSCCTPWKVHMSNQNLWQITTTPSPIPSYTKKRCKRKWRHYRWCNSQQSPPSKIYTKKNLTLPITQSKWGEWTRERPSEFQRKLCQILGQFSGRFLFLSGGKPFLSLAVWYDREGLNSCYSLPKTITSNALLNMDGTVEKWSMILSLLGSYGLLPGAICSFFRECIYNDFSSYPPWNMAPGTAIRSAKVDSDSKKSNSRRVHCSSFFGGCTEPSPKLDLDLHNMLGKRKKHIPIGGLINGDLPW